MHSQAAPDLPRFHISRRNPRHPGTYAMSTRGGTHAKYNLISLRGSMSGSFIDYETRNASTPR